ncbi:glycoside hydrolase family 66 protein, partial [Inconstantimicrobium porci]|uniref:glycoside hydrolase family 66 protein n=1 Tax=Inconstantimicrobium porci TaxID=2652291 RepID=UPI002409F4E1
MTQISNIKKCILSSVVLVAALPFYMHGSSAECNTLDVNINKIQTDKVRYDPSADAVISIDVKNNSNEKISKKLNLDIFQNEKKVYSTSKNVTLDASQSTAEDIIWNIPNNDNTGYIIKAYFDNDDFKTTALDVCSNWSVYPRYAYIPNFDKSITEKDIQNQIKTLTSDYYINAFQFYDWMWRHETPIKRLNEKEADSWSDLFDRDIQSDVVKNYVKAVQSKNAKAM